MLFCCETEIPVGHLDDGPLEEQWTGPRWQAVRDRVSLPITVMGGIDASNLAQVCAAGARRVAMVRGIIEGDVVKNVGRLYEIYRKAAVGE